MSYDSISYPPNSFSPWLMSIQWLFQIMMALNQGTNEPCPKLKSLQRPCSDVFKIQAFGRLPTLTTAGALHRPLLVYFPDLCPFGRCLSAFCCPSWPLPSSCSITDSQHQKVPLHCTVGLGWAGHWLCFATEYQPNPAQPILAQEWDSEQLSSMLHSRVAFG